MNASPRSIFSRLRSSILKLHAATRLLTRPDKRVRDDRAHRPTTPPTFPPPPAESYCLFIGVEQQPIGVNDSFCFCSSHRKQGKWRWGEESGAWMRALEEHLGNGVHVRGIRYSIVFLVGCYGGLCSDVTGAVRRSCTDLRGEETSEQLLLQRSLILADLCRR